MDGNCQPKSETIVDVPPVSTRLTTYHESNFSSLEYLTLQVEVERRASAGLCSVNALREYPWNVSGWLEDTLDKMLPFSCSRVLIGCSSRDSPFFYVFYVFLDQISLCFLESKGSRNVSV